MHEEAVNTLTNNVTGVQAQLDAQERAFTEKTVALRTSIELQMQKIKGQYEVIDALRHQIS